MSKKILLVSNGFYPENSPRSFRATELAKELVRQGNQVTVVTHPREGVEVFCQQNGIIFKSLGHLTWPAPTIKGKGLVRFFWRVVVRLSLLLFEYPSIQLVFLVKKALKKESGYDALISIAVPYPIHWGVASIWSKKIANVWIADCGDPYFGNINDSFKKMFYFKYIENWMFDKTDYISIPFEGARIGYSEKIQYKIRIIPQGLTFPLINQNDVVECDKIVKFAYSGNIGSYQFYLKLFSEQLDKIKIDYKFYIYTIEENIWLNTLSFEVLSKCEIKGYLSREELLKELARMDFLLHFPYKVELQKSLKLIDYLYLKKPILSFKGTKDDIKLLNEFLVKIYNQQIDYNIEEYKIENVSKKFTALIP